MQRERETLWVDPYYTPTTPPWVWTMDRATSSWRDARFVAVSHVTTSVRVNPPFVIIRMDDREKPTTSRLFWVFFLWHVVLFFKRL